MKSTPAICGDHLVPISECDCLRLLTRAKDFSRTADTTNARERGNEMNKVIIEVKGGVAWVAQQPENIEVEIIDYDNLGAGV
jgi:hypothetical protein